MDGGWEVGEYEQRIGVEGDIDRGWREEWTVDEWEEGGGMRIETSYMC